MILYIFFANDAFFAHANLVDFSAVQNPANFAINVESLDELADIYELSLFHADLAVRALQI